MTESPVITRHRTDGRRAVLRLGYFGFPDAVVGVDSTPIIDGLPGPGGQGVEVPNAFWMTSSPSGATLYAVTNVADAAVHAFAVGPDGGLVERNRVATGGAGAVHAAVLPDGRHLVVCHHDSCTVALLPVAADESIGEPSHVVAHTGSGPDPAAQAAPHPHMVAITPGGLLLVADKGTDCVHAYTRSGDELVPGPVSRMPAGGGPRHLVVDPDGDHVHVVGELDSTVTSAAIGPDGALTVTGRVSTLPDGWAGWNAPSGIVVEGGRVYVANRGHDSIAVFGIAGGTLTPVAHRSVRADRDTMALPWALAAGPGATLYVANHLTRAVQTYRVDTADGVPELVHEMPLDGPVAALHIG